MSCVFNELVGGRRDRGVFCFWKAEDCGLTILGFFLLLPNPSGSLLIRFNEKRFLHLFALFLLHWISHPFLYFVPFKVSPESQRSDCLD
jgi:hypothetical protein